MTIDMTPPPAVIEVYKKPVCISEWNGYKVFVEDYGKGNPDIGMPELLLYKDGKTRFANDKEINEIYASLPDD